MPTLRSTARDPSHRRRLVAGPGRLRRNCHRHHIQAVSPAMSDSQPVSTAHRQSQKYTDGPLIGVAPSSVPVWTRWLAAERQSRIMEYQPPPRFSSANSHRRATQRFRHFSAKTSVIADRHQPVFVVPFFRPATVVFPNIVPDAREFLRYAERYRTAALVSILSPSTSTLYSPPSDAARRRALSRPITTTNNQRS